MSVFACLNAYACPFCYLLVSYCCDWACMQACALLCPCLTHISVVSLGMPLGSVCSPLLLHRTTPSEHKQTSGQPDAGRQPLSSAPGVKGKTVRPENWTFKGRGVRDRRAVRENTKLVKEQIKNTKGAKEKGGNMEKQMLGYKGTWHFVIFINSFNSAVF